MTDNKSQLIFISGIDTDAGKSYATGYIAQQLTAKGLNVITQKFIQTGCELYSEDIELHRKIMGVDALEEDLNHTTAPVIFTYPASAQLAARIDGREIDLNIVSNASDTLAATHDIVLIEGAGGLMVPITDTYTTIDYVAEHQLPLGLVTNGKLGSINHTLLSLEAIQHRGIRLKWLIYNEHFDTDPVISADTRGYIRRYVAKHFPETEIIIVPSIEL